MKNVNFSFSDQISSFLKEEGNKVANQAVYALVAHVHLIGSTGTPCTAPLSAPEHDSPLLQEDCPENMIRRVCEIYQVTRRIQVQVFAGDIGKCFINLQFHKKLSSRTSSLELEGCVDSNGIISLGFKENH